MLLTACCIKKKSVLYSTRTEQSFCTVSHKSSRTRSALQLHQTFINRGKATPHGPTDVYKLKQLCVIESGSCLMLPHLQGSQWLAVPSREHCLFLASPLQMGCWNVMPRLSGEKEHQAQRVSKKLERPTLHSQHQGVERGLLYRGPLFYLPFLEFIVFFFHYMKYSFKIFSERTLETSSFHEAFLKYLFLKYL